MPKRGTGNPIGGRGEYGANSKGKKVSSEMPKGIFGIGKSKGD